MCDSADAYVHKLGYLQLGDESSTERGIVGGRVSAGGSRPEAQVPVVPRNSHQLQQQQQQQHARDASRGPRALGAIESFMDGGALTGGPAVEQHQQQQQQQTNRQAPLQPPDYKMYERENIIALSRFATPKPVEHLHHQTRATSQQQQQQQQQAQAPVYENIEYYPQQQAPPYYHPVDSRKSPRSSPRGSLAGETYEATFRKAQPQVPTGSRYQTASPAKELPPYEAPPVYENIQEVAHFDNEGQNKPGPQVPNYYHPANINGGDYVVMTGKVRTARSGFGGVGLSVD